MARPSELSTAYRISAQGMLVLILAQAVAGIVLHFLTAPRLETVHGAMEGLRSDGALRFLVNFHYFGSAVLILLAVVHLFGLLTSWDFAKSHRSKGLAALAVLLFAHAAQVSGNLLPADRHDVQTTVIEAAIAGQAPGVGATLQHEVLAGEQFGPATYDRWYVGHSAALGPLLLLAAMVACMGTKKGKKVIVPAVVPVLVALALSFVFTAPYGPNAGPDDFTSQDAVASWYTWPLHGALALGNKFGAGWIGALVFPGIVVGFVVLYFLFPGNKLGSISRWAALVSGAALFAMAPLFGGKPAPIVGLQDIPNATTSTPRSSGDPPVVTKFTEAEIAAGKVVFQKNCAGCHGGALEGSRVAPKLTNVKTKHSDIQWYLAFIRDPSKVKSGSVMPAFPNLTETELRNVSAVLLSAK